RLNATSRGPGDRYKGQALLRRSAGQVHEVQQLGELIFHDEGYFLLQGQPLALTPREQPLLTRALIHIS
ncbi:hypothetical protein V3C21_24925, partial [Salmonella enterica subsp. enterica serovar Paratyphi B]